MRRRALVIFVLAGMAVALGGVGGRIAYADQLRVSVRQEPDHRIGLMLGESLTDAQNAALRAEFSRTVQQLAGELPGWRCVGGEGPEASAIRLRFDASRPGPFDDGAYRLSVSLAVVTRTVSSPVLQLDWHDPEVRETVGTGDPVDGLAMLGRAAITDLMRGLQPCKLSFYFRLEGTAQITDARMTSRYTGEVTNLTLDEDGAATFDVPLEAAITYAGPCGTSEFQISGARLSGRLEYQDGNLRFGTLKVGHERITGSTDCEGVLRCEYTDTGIIAGTCAWPNGSGAATEGPGRPFSSSFGLFAGTGADLAGSDFLSVPLENAASMPLPRTGASSRVTWWNGDLTVEYTAQ